MVVIEVNGERQGLNFSACHVIQGHSKCGRMHGHNYFVSVKLEGDVKDGLLMDFGPLKEVVKAICREMDHRVLLPQHLTTTLKEEVVFETGGKRYTFPKEDVVLLPLEFISTEMLSQYFLKKIVENMDAPNVNKITVRVDESLGQGAYSERTL